MNPIRIVLADDHPLMREAIRRLLADAPGFQLVGEAADGAECLTRVEALRPDILLLDVVMPGIDGERVAQLLRERRPEVRIIALSGHSDAHFVRAMIRAGAVGYVLKSASGRELVHALEAVAAGESYLSPEIMGAVLKPDVSSAAEAGGVALEVLGKRELEVLRHIAEGQRSAQIARRLGIAVATVETHRRNILRKLQLHSASDLTRYAMRHGLVRL